MCSRTAKICRALIIFMSNFDTLVHSCLSRCSKFIIPGNTCLGNIWSLKSFPHSIENTLIELHFTYSQYTAVASSIIVDLHLSVESRGKLLVLLIVLVPAFLFFVVWFDIRQKRLPTWPKTAGEGNLSSEKVLLTEGRNPIEIWETLMAATTFCTGFFVGLS